MTTDKDSITFSQRQGLAALPAQLKLRELSQELRALLWAAIYDDIQECTSYNNGVLRIFGRWSAILRDHHIRIKFKMAEDFSTEYYGLETALSEFLNTGAYNHIFDLIEFIIRHSATPKNLRDQIAEAFVTSRAAYRIVDGHTVVPLGNESQARAIEQAVKDAKASGAEGAHTHLLLAAEALRKGDWSRSVCESISAVESVAIKLAPNKTTLGSALGALEQAGHLHGALKGAFSALYGYSSDEEGVRHALVLENKANVDEADALFMLGACASFVSYLISKGQSTGAINE